jgi:hypothetical protein
MGSGQPVRLEKSLSEIETFTHTMLDYKLDPKAESFRAWQSMWRKLGGRLINGTGPQ